MRNVLSTLLVMILLATCLQAQAPDTLWTGLYGDRAGWDGCDQLYGATATFDGCFAMNGYGTTCCDTIQGDQYVVKIDAAGDTVWTAGFGAFDRRDYGRDIIETYDSALLVVGHGRIANNTEDYRIRLFKVDSLGNEIWNKSYIGVNGFSTERVVETADSGFAVVGWTDDMDVFLFRADSLGDSVWTNTYGGASNDQGYDLRQTPDGGFMIAAMTESYGAGSWDAYIIRTDANGDTVWTRTFGTSGYEEAFGIAPTHDGHYLVAGSHINTNSDVWLIKIGLDGDTLWTKSVGQAAGNDVARGITATSDNGFLIAGKNYNTVDYHNDMYLLKVDAAGDTVWSYSYINNTHDEANVALQTETGNIYLFGTRAPSSACSYRDYWVFAFADAMDVPDDGREMLPVGFSLSHNYPNPFNPATTIEYTLPARSHVVIEIFNIMGQRVTTLVDGGLSAGQHKVIWAGRDQLGMPVASGIYLYRLVAGDFSSARKMLLLQ